MNKKPVYKRLEYGINPAKKWLKTKSYHSTYEPEFERQVEKYSLNGVEYSQISDMPQKYIGAVKSYIAEQGAADKYIFVFHSLPERLGLMAMTRGKIFFLGLSVVCVLAAVYMKFAGVDEELLFFVGFAASLCMCFFLFGNLGLHGRLIMLPSVPLFMIFGNIFSLKKLDEISLLALVTMLLITSLPLFIALWIKKVTLKKEIKRISE